MIHHQSSLHSDALLSRAHLHFVVVLEFLDMWRGPDSLMFYLLHTEHRWNPTQTPPRSRAEPYVFPAPLNIGHVWTLLQRELSSPGWYPCPSIPTTWDPEDDLYRHLQLPVDGAAQFQIGAAFLRDVKARRLSEVDIYLTEWTVPD